VIYKNQTFSGVANIGNRPTVDGCKTFLEVHLLEVNLPLYGQWLEVRFLHKLREEKKFSAVEALISQIHTDISRTKLFFEGDMSC
jgi:riboflavin kinase/FMN adenylyltransferase